MTRLDQLRSLARQLGLTAEDLDELVHDAKSAEAAAINNQGLGEQLAYLVDCYAADELEDRLRELKTEPRGQTEHESIPAINESLEESGRGPEGDGRSRQQ